MTFPDLPSWSFEVDEVSAGVYEVTAVDARGRRLQTRGTDPDALLAAARADALRQEPPR